MLIRTIAKILVGILACLGVIFIIVAVFFVLLIRGIAGMGDAPGLGAPVYGPPYWGIKDDQLQRTPQWTPDGAHIVFGERSVYVVDSAGSSLRLIGGDGGIDVAAIHPDVSPNGTRIAYAAYKHSTGWFPWNKDEDWEIVTANLDGSNRRRLTESDGRDTHPAWSPDGSRIAFVYGGRLEEWGIYVMAADGSGLRPVVKFADLTDNGSVYHRNLPPVWSPDGQRTAFVVRIYERIWGESGRGRIVGGKDGMVIVSVGVDGSGLRRLAEDASQPAWSPDGQSLMFTKHTWDSEFPLGFITGLYTVGLDGSEPRELVSFHRGRVGWTDDISWHPGGSAVLFGSPVTSANRVNDSGLHRSTDAADFGPSVIAAVDGSEVRELPSPGTQASWSPDGSRIALYAQSSDSRAVLYTMSLDGSDIRVLVERDEDGDLAAANGRPLNDS